jgi:hypothetical protein
MSTPIRRSSTLLTQGLAIAMGALVLLVAACDVLGSPAGDRVVTADDVEVARGRCEDLVAAAARALDERDPGHPPVMGMQLHERRRAPTTIGGLQYVAVYVLADGSVRAIGVGWPGVATTPYTIENGP